MGPTALATLKRHSAPQMCVTSDEALEAVTLLTTVNLRKSLCPAGVFKAATKIYRARGFLCGSSTTTPSSAPFRKSRSHLLPTNVGGAGFMDLATPSIPKRPSASWMSRTANKDLCLTSASSTPLVISKISWWRSLLVTKALCCTYVRAKVPVGDPRTKPA